MEQLYRPNIFSKNASSTIFTKKENRLDTTLSKTFSTRNRVGRGEFFNVVPETIPDIFQQTLVCSNFFKNPYFGSLLPRLLQISLKLQNLSKIFQKLPTSEFIQDFANVSIFTNFFLISQKLLQNPIQNLSKCYQKFFF